MSTTSPTPTTELEAVNTMLSGIGEAPVNSLSEVTADVSLARHILNEVSREIQLEGFQWNTEDDYPLTPDIHGLIKLHPSIVRVHFREPSDRELTIRGNQVYDRINHTFTFPQGTAIVCTVTLLLPFEQLPEAARRYTTLKALRIFQERVVGSQVLSQYQQADEARARVQLMGEERRQDRPNLLMGAACPPVGTWRVRDAVLRRGNNPTRRLGF
ncbi:hypothetical protein [Bilophila wadsworthia]|uniref:hypothetical protein n=1 Tax=Bilophila wadsworthia TaxID=35833 RepID=UPI003AB4D8B7